ncbi:hypothetical protein [Oricola sp.]|uniref:hypothetical protein n=1 Tax=Oricola sp. TaxID=1979950 RepID=UPI0025DA9460|nr:hypothetical protein [Oricola sp.]MCI5073977.1 hypothetical protein [Oricola sp.]
MYSSAAIRSIRIRRLGEARIRVVIPALLKKYAELAIARLGYLYPAARFTLCDNCIEVSGEFDVAEETIAKEINYALYRERIFAETLSMRQDLISAVTRR